MRPYVLGFSGFSDSGKTTLIERLIPYLSAAGLKVFVIKHDAHDFEMDKEGKDTYRFTAAGADCVMISSDIKSARLMKRPASLDEMIGDSKEADIVLVEGYKDSDIPRFALATVRTGYSLPGKADDFIALITDDPDSLHNICGDTGNCPVFLIDDTDRIGDFILDQMNKNNDDLTHFDDKGNARMVNVSDKDITHRIATARGRVFLNADTFYLVKSGGVKKGDVLTVAQVAGIMGAKKTPNLIPMCHPVVTDGTDVVLTLNEESLSVDIEARVECTGRTGVEMEAICACSVAAMTVYDMCKAVQRDIVIGDIRLIRKSGGVHGDYDAEAGLS